MSCGMRSAQRPRRPGPIARRASSPAAGGSSAPQNGPMDDDDGVQAAIHRRVVGRP